MTSTSPFWCTESLIVTVNGPEGRSIITVDKPFARVGSHARSEVILRGESIDPRCLYLHGTPEGVFCVSLLPTQHLKLGAGKWLRDNEIVSVGPYEISVRLQRESTGSPPRVALTAWGSGTPPLPVCHIFSAGKILDKRRFRARLNFIGRRRELALQLQGLQVSSCHCVLYWDAGQLWCIDLLSSNGTLFDDQPFECRQLEFGQSLQIGEFSLLLKRLSRSAERPSSWRTGESDEDLLASDVEHPAEPRHAVAPAPTTSLVPGEARKSPPDAVNVPQVLATINAATPESQQQRVRVHEELRQKQDQVQRELTWQSQQLIAQRHQLDQQLSQATQDLASQISHLQSESASLVSQRKEVQKLRAAWEEQRRILTEDLEILNEEIAQRETVLNEQKRRPPIDPVNAIAPISKIAGREETDPEDCSGVPGTSSATMTSLERPRSLEPHSPPSAAVPGRTVIEGSYVVERETSPLDFTSRQAPNPDHSNQAPLPLGRRRATDLPPGISMSGDRESEPNAQHPELSASTHPEDQGLTIAASSTTSAAPGKGQGNSRQVPSRRKQADEDLMGAMLTDRMVLRDGSRGFWLKVLWGCAAAVSLLALTALGYLLINAR